LWERLSGLGHVAVKPQKKAIEKAEQVAHRARVYLKLIGCPTRASKTPSRTPGFPGYPILKANISI
jgi:hypothetical protein